tara:strand:- start:749 stop:1033 length:285 start_codon:yes stop_codon:yes gene_type:complete
MKEMTLSEYRNYKMQQSFPAKDKKTALATGKTRYFSRCKWGHEVRYTTGPCIGCQQKRIREKQKQQGQPSAMIDIEKLKDEMKLQALIGEGYEE